MAATLGGAAIWYAGRGHLVFPLRPGTKIPATRNGFKDASMNPDTIRAWWTENPNYNIGLTTGHLFDVIDVDGGPGIRSIAEIEDEGHLPPVVARVNTPHGLHLYINPTGDGCGTAIRPGIDYRGIGGYVVAPPSINDEPCSKDWCQGQCQGATYRWSQPLELRA